MARKGKISELYDLSAIKAQQGKVVSMLDVLVEKINSVSKVKLNLQSSVGKPSEIIAATKAIADAQKEQTKAINEAIKANILLEKTKQSLAKTAVAEEKVKQESARTTLAELKISEQVTKQKQLEEKARLLAVKATERQSVALEKARIKAEEEERPYKRLAFAFAAAAKQAQDLAAKYGLMDKRAQEAARRANELNNQLKKIDSSIGNDQRNVGNYSAAVDKVGVSIRGLVTNFLTLIGVVGVGSVFSSAVDEFVEMDKNVRLLQNTLNNLGIPEAFKRIEISSNRLAKEFKFLDNDDILKTFNQLIVYGKLTEKQINELIPVIINFAAATGQDLGSATSVIIKALEGNGRALKEFGVNIKDAKNVSEAFGLIMKQLAPRVEGVGKAFSESAAGGLAVAKQEFKNLKEEIGAGLLPVLNSLLSGLNKVGRGLLYLGQQAKIVISDIATLFLEGSGAVAADRAVREAEKQTRIENAAAAAIAAAEKTRDNIQILLDKRFRSKADISSLVQRGALDAESAEAQLKEIEKGIRVLNKALSLVSDIGFDASFGTDGKKDGSKEAAERAERIRKAIFETAKALQEENIKIQEEIFKDDKQSFDKRIEALREFVQEKARLIELERTFEKGAKGLLKEEIEKIEADKQTDLNELLRTGHSEYNRILEQQKKEEENIHKETADRIKKIHEDLQKAIEKGLKDADDRLKKQNQEREDFEKERSQLRGQLVQETEGLIFDILTASFDRQKNLIQDEIDALERKKQKDIEVANATITNAQDRAAAITVIEARAAAEREALEQKQRQIDLQRARFEKAESIANIITKTAEAIISTLAKTPPPPGLILAGLIGAIGAAQLARVIATPIPRFRHGTDSHKGGLMIVGDGGKPEGIQLPDGTVMKTPSSATLMDAPKGTKVYPDFSKMMLKATLTDVPIYKGTTRSDMATPQILTGLRLVEKAINKIPQTQIQVQNIISKRIRSSGSIINYITRKDVG